MGIDAFMFARDFVPQIQEGEEADLTLISVNLTTIIETDNEATPSIDFVSITLCLAIVSTLRRRK